MTTCASVAFVPQAALSDYALAACRWFGQMRRLLTWNGSAGR